MFQHLRWLTNYELEASEVPITPRTSIVRVQSQSDILNVLMGVSVTIYFIYFVYMLIVLHLLGQNK